MHVVLHPLCFYKYHEGPLKIIQFIHRNEVIVGAVADNGEMLFNFHSTLLFLGGEKKKDN